MKWASSFILSICLLLGMSFTAFAADTATVQIGVSATDACFVTLKGISENTENYQESKKVVGEADFSISHSEPGQYEYELKQVKAEGLEIYDETVYQVFVNVIYEDNKITSVVTGALKGTEVKPERFEFQRTVDSPPPEPPTTPTPDPGPKTGDQSNYAMWLKFFVLGAAGVLLVVLVTVFQKKREKKNGD